MDYTDYPAGLALLSTLLSRWGWPVLIAVAVYITAGERITLWATDALRDPRATLRALCPHAAHADAVTDTAATRSVHVRTAEQLMEAQRARAAARASASEATTARIATDAASTAAAAAAVLQRKRS